MIYTKELLMLKRDALRQAREQDLANANAKLGAIKVLNELIDTWEEPAPAPPPIDPPAASPDPPKD